MLDFGAKITFFYETTNIRASEKDFDKRNAVAAAT